MTKMKKKFEAGAATNYISRTQAVRKLQISLKDFRRLCILKGIYPHEPAHKKKVNKGSTANKTFYYVKDIQFLHHEPLIRKFREYKVFLRRLKKAKAKTDRNKEDRIRSNKPKYRLDAIVKERYPTSIDAIRDLDDALCLCFLFSRLPKNSKLTTRTSQLCRRLVIEFMHYVIAAKALKKVFVSIKGIYYQADIVGQTVTWLVPHDRGTQPVTDVDFAVMATFVEFYCYMLGFVNFSLYSTLGLHYPPKLSGGVAVGGDEEEEVTMEKVYSLAHQLEVSAQTQIEEEENLMDDFSLKDGGSEEMEKAKIEAAGTKRLQHLFSGCRLFLNREVPRESLVFIIRACGGTVSWDPNFAPGSTYQEDDEKITHQIVDRPVVKQQNINRNYIQPQWIYDCVNARSLLPLEDYFPGTLLPPHLSPFVEEKPGDYIPPERIRQLEAQGQDVTMLMLEKDDQLNAVSSEPRKKKPKTLDAENKEENKMEVSEGKIKKVHPQKKINEAGEEKKLREMMIAKKHKRVYQKIKKGTRKQERKVEELRAKRKLADSTKT